MTILAAIVIVILGVTAILFGSATAVMISREIADRKLKKQDYWTEQIEDLLEKRLSDRRDIYEEFVSLREEVYDLDLKQNERITAISINQNILENNLEKILNK